jgi:hypothetical protein
MRVYSEDEMREAFLIAFAAARFRGDIRDRSRMDRMTEKTANHIFENWLKQNEPGADL